MDFSVLQAAPYSCLQLPAVNLDFFSVTGHAAHGVHDGIVDVHAPL